MTIEGAIVQLQELIDNDEIPFWAKPSLQKVMETVEMEREQRIEERKTGKWVIRGGIHNMYTSYACSECGREIEMYYDFGNIPTDADVINEFPYCHCGAKMEVDE